jgi:uncharacterized damage-inducible protein DinB
MNAVPVLIQHNIYLIEQGMSFIECISDDLFVRPSIGSAAGGIGPHLRHVIEHYESLIHGLPSGRIDYDMRKRDPEVEKSRTAAIKKLEAIRGFLFEFPTEMELQLATKFESHGSELHDDIWTSSTLGRELISVLSHTVHHFAIISMLARYHGVVPPDGFGIAPATLRFMATSR